MRDTEMSTLETSREDLHTKARQIEWDMVHGTKRLAVDLDWYITYKTGEFQNKPHWRHKEDQNVYEFCSLGLACTGSGTLVLMVHFKPEGTTGPCFERQYEPFLMKFEPVRPSRIWEKH
jgi:hypothetical protein